MNLLLICIPTPQMSGTNVTVLRVVFLNFILAGIIIIGNTHQKLVILPKLYLKLNRSLQADTIMGCYQPGEALK